MPALREKRYRARAVGPPVSPCHRVLTTSSVVAYLHGVVATVMCVLCVPVWDRCAGLNLYTISTMFQVQKTAYYRNSRTRLTGCPPLSQLGLLCNSRSDKNGRKRTELSLSDEFFVAIQNQILRGDLGRFASRGRHVQHILPCST